MIHFIAFILSCAALSTPIVYVLEKYFNRPEVERIKKAVEAERIRNTEESAKEPNQPKAKAASV